MAKGKLRTVEGDVTNPQRTMENEIVLIPHCCNNGVGGNGVGVMGGGVALSLRNKWPSVYGVYKEMELQTNNGLRDTLGKVCYAEINNHLVVANMIGQDGLASKNNPIPVKYVALVKCMTKVVDYIKMIEVQTGNTVVIHTPQFGSDLAKGDWGFILELIREIWLESGINCVIYNYVK